LRPGDHLVVSRDLYGGTYRLLRRVWEDGGLSFSPAELTDPAAIDAAWRDETRMVWVESPTNPRLQIIDIAAVAEVARGRGAWTVVDNTLASPYLQRPLARGADVVVHSTTKYLGGHSDVLGGFAGTSDDGLAERLGLLQAATGAVPGPVDAFLILRGVKTLAVRMERHCANAAAVAEFLAGHPAVSEVFYPGLPAHPGHDLAARQMSGFGGMVSFTLAGGEEAAKAVCAATQLFSLGGSLGGVESLISYPPTMSHFPMQGTELAADPALVRLSVGIESAADLIADLDGALASLA
jgi:cystathionine gamma-synthase